MRLFAEAGHGRWSDRAAPLTGVARQRRRGEPWPIEWVTAFRVLRLGGFAFTTMSFLGGYQQVLFPVRAAQIITLLMVVPLYLALGSLRSDHCGGIRWAKEYPHLPSVWPLLPQPSRTVLSD